MINVSCGVEAENHECLKIHNCESDNRKIIIETTDGKRFVVEAEDLITAIKNATNINFPTSSR